MMSLTADEIAIPPRPGVADAAGLTIVDGLSAIEAEWRHFEEHALATPYARFDWVRAFAGRDAAGVKVVTRRDPDGRLDLLWALRMVRCFGIAVAVPVGGRHANLNLPLLRRDAAAVPPRELLQAIGRRLGADLVSIARVPESWADEPVALATLGRPNPDVAPTFRLDEDHETTARRTMSNEARKRLRNKERGLARHGPVSFRVARTRGEVDDLLRTFFRQKAERFGALGIADPFADGGVREAIRAAATAKLEEGRPPVELYGLRVGDRTVAVLGAAVSASHLSGMFISFEHWPEILRFSPGDILMSRVVQAQFAAGRSRLDFGTGRAHYKSIFCDEEIPLRDVVVPVTAAGSAVALGLRAALAGKACLKRSPWAMSVIRRLRRARPGPSF